MLSPLLVCGQVTNTPGHRALAQQPESVRVPLIRADSEEFPGDAAAKDFFVQLPEHVSFHAGCELRLGLDPSFDLLSRLCTITASINGQPLSGARLEGKTLDNIDDLGIRVRFLVPEKVLIHGWNGVSVRFVLKKPIGGTQDPGTWAIRRSDSYLGIVYQRSPLFPELARFPGSVAEEKLLHPAPGGTDSGTPTLTLVVPAQRRDVHLRACAVIGARLGQLGYLSAEDCRIASFDRWPAENQDGNGIAVGRRDELGTLSLPRNVADKLAALQTGQGLIAEFIDDARVKQRRWVLVAGADDPGLEKAVLTLGNASALTSAPPNPSILNATPAVSRELELTSQPDATRLVLKDLGVSEVRLTGLHTMAQSVSGWRLPPGFALSSGVLDLHYRHSPALVSPGSWLEVFVNGTKAGAIELNPGSAAAGSAQVHLPSGLGGRDPMTLTFRAHLDVGPVDCTQRQQDEPWLIVAGDSTLQTTPSPMPVQGLNQVGRLLLGDSFLRRTALLVPTELSLDELSWLVAVSMHLGKQLPSSRVLWPEVCSYSKKAPPPRARLQDRAILLLGSTSQWGDALPTEAPVPVKMNDPRSGAIRMQGSEMDIASFESSLAFLQMTPSPWSQGEWLVMAGGWREFATAPLLRLLTDPNVTAGLRGNICAMDAGGRIAAYDTRQAAPDSLAERIQSRIPAGLTVEQTKRRAESQRIYLGRDDRINSAVFYGCGVLLVFVLGCRLLLMWERTRRLKEARQAERRPLERAA